MNPHRVAGLIVLASLTLQLGFRHPSTDGVLITTAILWHGYFTSGNQK